MNFLWDLTTGNQDVYHENMNGKLLLAQLGFGLSRILGRKRRERISPLTKEREQFEDDMRSQFEQLKKKGLSIPVFTL